jgi:hypothetical protein
MDGCPAKIKKANAQSLDDEDTIFNQFNNPFIFGNDDCTTMT